MDRQCPRTGRQARFSWAELTRWQMLSSTASIIRRNILSSSRWAKEVHPFLAIVAWFVQPPARIIHLFSFKRLRKINNSKEFRSKKTRKVFTGPVKASREFSRPKTVLCLNTRVTYLILTWWSPLGSNLSRLIIRSSIIKNTTFIKEGKVSELQTSQELVVCSAKANTKKGHQTHPATQ